MWDRISSSHSPWNLLAVERATPSSPSFRSKTLKSTLIPLSYTPNPFTSVFSPPAYTNTQNPTAPLLPWAAILRDDASRAVQSPLLPASTSHHHLSHLHFCSPLLPVLPISTPAPPQLYPTATRRGLFTNRALLPLETLPWLPHPAKEGDSLPPPPLSPPPV